MRIRLPARSQTGRAVAGRPRAQSDSDLLRIIPPPRRARHIHICTSAHDSRFADQESGESSAASVTRILRIFLFPRHPRCACREPFSEWKVVEGPLFMTALSPESRFSRPKSCFSKPYFRGKPDTRWPGCGRSKAQTRRPTIAIGLWKWGSGEALI